MIWVLLACIYVNTTVFEDMRDSIEQLGGSDNFKNGTHMLYVLISLFFTCMAYQQRYSPVSRHVTDWINYVPIPQ